MAYKPGKGRRPDRLTNPDAGDVNSAASWAATLPFDKAVAGIERSWGTLDAFLAACPRNDLVEKLARVFAKLNAAIEGLDLDAQRKHAENALKGLRRIREINREEGKSPPKARFLAHGDVIVAETIEDARKLGTMEGTKRVYALEEIGRIVDLFEEKNETIRELKKMGAEYKGAPNHANSEKGKSDLDDEIPF